MVWIWIQILVSFEPQGRSRESRNPFYKARRETQGARVAHHGHALPPAQGGGFFSSVDSLGGENGRFGVGPVFFLRTPLALLSIFAGPNVT